jgi:inward rectifier potassium channel
MAFLKKFNTKAKAENETGLGTNSNLSAGRFFNKNGQPNINVSGMKLFERINVFHELLTISWFKFISIIVIFFITINLLFACIFLAMGIEHLSGMIAISPTEKFGEAFFFSCQTFTTVGYGRINPIGLVASFTASLEALTGLMTFAVITGLIYGRFSRPRAYLRYSKNALFVPFRNGVAVMFRMVPFTKNYMVNVEVKATLAIRVLEDEQVKNKFFSLTLDLSKANSLTSNWTLVHMINEESPFYNLSKEDIINSNAEVMVFVQGFDETFSNTVISRTSYSYEDFVYGAKFVQMYHPDETKTTTILELNKLDEYTLAKLPVKY